MENELSIHYS